MMSSDILGNFICRKVTCNVLLSIAAEVFVICYSGHEEILSLTDIILLITVHNICVLSFPKLNRTDLLICKNVLWMV